jgi:hypothetical protein
MDDLLQVYGWYHLAGLTLAAATAALCAAALFVPRLRPHRMLAGMGLVTALLAFAGSFATIRFIHAGRWVPPPPDDVGNWTAIDTPLDPTVMAGLGNPASTGREYRNPFGEVVYYTAVSAGPFENYHDPTVCVGNNGFTLTAKREFLMPGSGGPAAGGAHVRAMVFKRGDLRILMYYWTQSRQGVTATDAVMGNYKDMAARFQTGYSSVIRGDQNVIIRNYAVIPPDDPDGVQTQHNLDEICRATYDALRADGKKAAGI